MNSRGVCNDMYRFPHMYILFVQVKVCDARSQVNERLLSKRLSAAYLDAAHGLGSRSSWNANGLRRVVLCSRSLAMQVVTVGRKCGVPSNSAPSKMLCLSLSPCWSSLHLLFLFVLYARLVRNGTMSVLQRYARASFVPESVSIMPTLYGVCARVIK